MTLTLEVGKQYKTRGGWRCVVVDKAKYVTVWHSKTNSIIEHFTDGYRSNIQRMDYDIISKWVEPKVHEVWVGIDKINYSIGEQFNPFVIYSKPNASSSLIGLRKITITEGEFDE